jgi:hypothetical protein
MSDLPPGFTKPDDLPPGFTPSTGADLPPGFTAGETPKDTAPPRSGLDRILGSIPLPMFPAGQDYLGGVSAGMTQLGTQAGKLIEDIFGVPLSRYVPQAVQEEQRRAAENAPAGSQLQGNIGPFLMMPEPAIIKGLSYAPRLLYRGGIPGALQPTDADPSKGQTVRGQTAVNAATGMGVAEALRIVGLGLGKGAAWLRNLPPSGQELYQRALRTVRDWNYARSQQLEEHAAEVAKQRAAHETARQAAIDAVKGRAADIKTEAREHAAATAYAKSLHDAAAQSAKLAGETAGTGYKSDVAGREAIHDMAVQAAKETQRAATEEQAATTEATKGAIEAIPMRTTQTWWREALKPLGMEDQAPAELNRETSRTVQDKIGGALNRIRGQMVFDTTPLTSNYAGTLAKLDAVESHTANSLDPSALPEWQRTYKKFVSDRLGGRMTGSDLADYISQIGKEAQRMRLSAAGGATNAPQLYRMADGLMDTIEQIEGASAVPNRAIRSQLAAAKRAYHLWSIGDEATSAGGTTPYEATPGRIAAVWERRRGGSPARYAADTHPDDARLQNWLTAQQRAMGAEVKPEAVPYQGPGAFVPPPAPAAPPGPGPYVPPRFKSTLPAATPTPEEKVALQKFQPPPKPPPATPEPKRPLRSDFPGSEAGDRAKAVAGAALHMLGVPYAHSIRHFLDPGLLQVARMAARMSGAKPPGMITSLGPTVAPSAAHLPSIVRRDRRSADDEQ